MKFKKGDRVKVNSSLCPIGTVEEYDPGLDGYKVYSDESPAKLGGLPYCFSESDISYLDAGSRPRVGKMKSWRRKLDEGVAEAARQRVESLQQIVTDLHGRIGRLQNEKHNKTQTLRALRKRYEELKFRMEGLEK